MRCPCKQIMSVNTFSSFMAGLMFVFGATVLVIVLVLTTSGTNTGYDMNVLQKRAKPVLQKIVNARNAKLKSIREGCTNNLGLDDIPGVPISASERLINQYNDNYNLEQFLGREYKPAFPVSRYYYNEDIDILL